MSPDGEKLQIVAKAFTRGIERWDGIEVSS